MKLTDGELKLLAYYAYRAGRRHRPDVVMPLESVHALQRLAGEAESSHEFSACRVDRSRLVTWLRRIADRYEDAPQEIAGGW